MRVAGIESLYLDLELKSAQIPANMAPESFTRYGFNGRLESIGLLDAQWHSTEF